VILFCLKKDLEAGALTGITVAEPNFIHHVGDWHYSSRAELYQPDYSGMVETVSFELIHEPSKLT
jgi:hypothetical protein